MQQACNKALPTGAFTMDCMTDETPELVLYRADVKGLKPWSDTARMKSRFDNQEYTYATTNLDVARAFAVFAFGVPRDHERSIYRVNLDDPLAFDPEFHSGPEAHFYMSHWGTVVETVEPDVTMTVEQAKRVMSRYALWVGGNRIYDDDGYATVPPRWCSTRFDQDIIQQELRTLGTFPEPDAVVRFLNENFAF
jgi:hypothetical protein